MSRSRKSKKGPKRPLVCAVIGLPDSGKSTLIRRLLPMLENAKISAISIAQDKPGDIITKMFRALVGVSGRNALPDIHRDTRSLIYRAIARVAHDKARRSKSRIVLLEHDPNFTWIMERHWAGVSARRLMPDFEKMTEPDLVIYLPVPPEEAEEFRKMKYQKRGVPYIPRTPEEWECLHRIYAEMNAVAAEKNWRQILSFSGKPFSMDEMADIALRELLIAYHYRTDHPQPLKKFWMREMGGKKRHLLSTTVR